MLKKLRYIVVIACWHCSLFAQMAPEKQPVDPKNAYLAQKKQCQILESELDQLALTLQSYDQKLNQIKEFIAFKTQDIDIHQVKLNELAQKIQKFRLKKKNLKKDNQAYVTLALRLSRTPPELFLGLHHNSHETVLGLHYLKSILTHLKEKSIKYNRVKLSLKQDQTELLKMEHLLHSEKEKFLQEELGLRNLKESAEKLRQEKENLLIQEKKNLQKSACNLHSVRELLNVIPQEKPLTQEAVISLSPKKGQFLKPVDGIIMTHFGEDDDQGHKSHGIRFETNPHCVVKAPFDGKVAFSGPFRHYSNIVIMDHNQGYHSLLMGLEKVAVKVGQVLRKGDAIGQVVDVQKLGDDFDRPRFSLEFRLHGQPIDPLPWFEK